MPDDPGVDEASRPKAGHLDVVFVIVLAVILSVLAFGGALFLGDVTCSR